MSKDKAPKPPKNAGKRIHIFKAIFGTILAAVVYIGIPYMMLNYVIPNHMIEDAVNGLVIDWTNIKPLFERWLYLGVPLTVLAFPVWLFPKGSRGRLMFSIIFMVASICWLVYVMNFGNLDGLVNITFNGVTYGFGIVLSGLMYIIVFFKALKILTIYAIYKDNRENYLRRFRPLEE